MGKREMSGRVMVEKEVVKEALTELLNEIPAFKYPCIERGLASDKAVRYESC